MRLPWLWIAGALLAGSSATADGAVWVATRTVEPAAHAIALPAKVGLLDAGERRALAFEVSGRLERLAPEGARLAAGDVVASLDDELQRVHLRQAGIRLDEARSELKRVRGLRASNAASTKALERAETALALAETERAGAREELARRTLRAPFDGVVAETHYEEAEVVAPGAPVAVFMQLAELRVEVGLPGYQVTRVAAGAAAEVTVPALGPEAFAGVVRRVAPAAANGGHLFEVEVRVPNPDGRLRPGMSAAVRIVTRELPSAVVVPLGVAVEREGRRVVFFVADGRARAVDAGEGLVDGDRLVLVEEVPYRELVVRGQRDLRDGDAVQVDDAVLDGSDEGLARPAVRGPRP